MFSGDYVALSAVSKLAIAHHRRRRGSEREKHNVSKHV